MPSPEGEWCEKPLLERVQSGYSNYSWQQGGGGRLAYHWHGQSDKILPAYGLVRDRS